MAELADILDFETPVERAVCEAMHAATGIAPLISRAKGLTPHQFTGARLTLGAPLNHHHALSPTLSVEAAFQATLTFYVRTLREDTHAAFPTDLHAAMRAQVRVFMLTAIETVNAQLTLHELAGETVPQGSDISYSDDRYDITELPYQVTLYVKPAAWPS